MTLEIIVQPLDTLVSVDSSPIDVVLATAILEVNPISTVLDLIVDSDPIEIILDPIDTTVITAALQGPQGIRGPVGPSGSGGFELEAGENINANMPIKVSASGLAYVASNLIDTDAGNVVGIAQHAALISETLLVTRGESHNNAWTWLAGPIYLGDRTLTQVPPSLGFTQIIATAVSPVDIVGTLFQPTLQEH